MDPIDYPDRAKIPTDVDYFNIYPEQSKIESISSSIKSIRIAKKPHFCIRCQKHVPDDQKEKPCFWHAYIKTARKFDKDISQRQIESHAFQLGKKSERFPTRTLYFAGQENGRYLCCSKHDETKGCWKGSHVFEEQGFKLEKIDIIPKISTLFLHHLSSQNKNPGDDDYIEKQFTRDEWLPETKNLLSPTLTTKLNAWYNANKWATALAYEICANSRFMLSQGYAEQIVKYAFEMKHMLKNIVRFIDQNHRGKYNDLKDIIARFQQISKTRFCDFENAQSLNIKNMAKMTTMIYNDKNNKRCSCTTYDYHMDYIQNLVQRPKGSEQLEMTKQPEHNLLRALYTVDYESQLCFPNNPNDPFPSVYDVINDLYAIGIHYGKKGAKNTTTPTEIISYYALALKFISLPDLSIPENIHLKYIEELKNSMSELLKERNEYNYERNERNDEYDDMVTKIHDMDDFIKINDAELILLRYQNNELIEKNTANKQQIDTLESGKKNIEDENKKRIDAFKQVNASLIAKNKACEDIKSEAPEKIRAENITLQGNVAAMETQIAQLEQDAKKVSEEKTVSLSLIKEYENQIDNLTGKYRILELKEKHCILGHNTELDVLQEKYNTLDIEKNIIENDLRELRHSILEQPFPDVDRLSSSLSSGHFSLQGTTPIKPQSSIINPKTPTKIIPVEPSLKEVSIVQSIQIFGFTLKTTKVGQTYKRLFESRILKFASKYHFGYFLAHTNLTQVTDDNVLKNVLIKPPSINKTQMHNIKSRLSNTNLNQHKFSWYSLDFVIQMPKKVTGKFYLYLPSNTHILNMDIYTKYDIINYDSLKKYAEISEFNINNKGVFPLEMLMHILKIKVLDKSGINDDIINIYEVLYTFCDLLKHMVFMNMKLENDTKKLYILNFRNIYSTESHEIEENIIYHIDIIKILYKIISVIEKYKDNIIIDTKYIINQFKNYPQSTVEETYTLSTIITGQKMHIDTFIELLLTTINKENNVLDIDIINPPEETVPLELTVTPSQPSTPSSLSFGTQIKNLFTPKKSPKPLHLLKTKAQRDFIKDHDKQEDSDFDYSIEDDEDDDTDYSIEDDEDDDTEEPAQTLMEMSHDIQIDNITDEDNNDDDSEDNDGGNDSDKSIDIGSEDSSEDIDPDEMEYLDDIVTWSDDDEIIVDNREIQE